MVKRTKMLSPQKPVIVRKGLVPKKMAKQPKMFGGKGK